MSSLRPLEALVRRILLIEAAALPPRLFRPYRAPRRTPRTRRTAEQDPKRSESWRAAFRALPRAHAASHRPAPKQAPGAEPRSPWPPGSLEDYVCPDNPPGDDEPWPPSSY